MAPFAYFERRPLYEIHNHSRSPNSIAKGFKHTSGIIREQHSYPLKTISHNLDYLVQKGWATEESKTKQFRQNGIVRNQIQKIYKISDVGIEHYEDASTFDLPKERPTINITNINGVTVLGDGNIVNTQYTELIETLNEIKNAIGTASIGEPQKLDAIADIESIQSQLSKPKPNKYVISTLINSLGFIASVDGIANLWTKVNNLISPLLS